MSALYRFTGPLLRCLEPETAHGVALKCLKWGLLPQNRGTLNPALEMKVWGMSFPNPVGLAAGFDKDAEVPDAMLAQGFGFVEAGSITPKPQDGNPKPRLFRLKEDNAVINRMGFNNKGIDAACELLKKRAHKQGIVGINLGKNKTTEDAASDYEAGVRKLAPYASYMVINVSSPNTPGLRALQGRGPLEDLLGSVRRALNETVPENTPPLLLKIAPDLTEEDRSDIAAVVLAEGADGLIATNTTITRPDSLISSHKAETGGLSGTPVFDASTQVLSDMYRLTQGKLPIIGVGGISDAKTAYAKIRAGASLVQLYSVLVYQGTDLVHDILKDLPILLKADGFSTLAEAVGADHR